jgi:hypothetical protein
MVVRGSLYLDHIDSYLLAQESLVSIEGVHPALVQRQAVADHVARLLNQLGLDRVARKLGTLESFDSSNARSAKIGLQRLRLAT